MTNLLMPWLVSLPHGFTGGLAHSDLRKFVHSFYNTPINSTLLFPSPQKHPPELWGHLSFLSHSHTEIPPPAPRFSSGQVGHAGEELSLSLLRCWNKSSPWSLIWSSSMGPSQRKVERQMLNNKYIYPYLHTNFHWQELPICLTSS